MVDLLVIEDIISLKVNLLQSKLFFLWYLLILHTGFLVGLPGTDPGFQVRGGGGALKNFVWGISCEKSRFYTKKSYFFQLRREARKCLGYFVWKITILCQKIILFPVLGCALPPGSAPGCSIFSFICMFCWSLFVLLYFFFWPLCCLFFFVIRILITPLVSSIVV
jgi:hypothetical protein